MHIVVENIENLVVWLAGRFWAVKYAFGAFFRRVGIYLKIRRKGVNNGN